MAITQLGITNKINSGINGFYQKNLNKSMNKILSYCSTLRRFNTPQDVAIGLPDSFNKWQWEAYFPSIAIDNGIGAGVKAITYTPILENITIQFPSVKTDEMNFGPRSINVPSSYKTHGSVTGTFYCDNRLQIVNYFNTWRTMVRDDWGLYGFPEDYKKDAFIYALGMKSIVPVYVFKFKGIFPTSLGNMVLNSDSKGGRITCNITFVYDDILYEPVKMGQTAATYLDGNIAGIMANQAQSSGMTYLNNTYFSGAESKIYG